MDVADRIHQYVRAAMIQRAEAHESLLAEAIILSDYAHLDRIHSVDQDGTLAVASAWHPDMVDAVRRNP